MLVKPEKKDCTNCVNAVLGECVPSVKRNCYNRSCNDWERFLPSKDEIASMISWSSDWEEIAKALAKRIGKE